MTENLPASWKLQLPETLPRVGLTLGGGGARGLAHVHVIEAFDDLGIRPAIISGTSIGALFGAAYASGLSAAAIRGIAEDTLNARFDLIRQMFSARSVPLQKFFNIFHMRSSLLDAEALLDLLLPKHFPDRFEDLAIPLRIVATDLSAREAIIFDKGDLRKAIAASIAIPVLFSPVVVEGRAAADGGIIDPLPYDTIRADAEITVAIDVSGGSSETTVGPNPSISTMLTQSLQILQKTIIRERLRHVEPDIYVEVDLDSYGALQFHKAKAIIAASEPVKELVRSKLLRVLSSQVVR
ncbi:MAG: patatin-like phospholipase family protein [Hyphomicrobiaceae bacterium]